MAPRGGLLAWPRGFGDPWFLIHRQLPMGTTLHIEEALLYTESTRNLLSFKDIRANGFHVETSEEDDREYLYITKRDSDERILENFPP